MPTAIPGPLPPWAATLAKLTGGAGHSYLDDLLVYFKEEPDPTNLEWRHLAVHADNQASTDVADDAIIGFDIANITGGALDTSWTTADYTTCEGLFTTFLTSCVGQMHNMFKFDRYSWYRKQFNPYTEAKPFADGGPPQRQTTIAIQSATTNYTPAQVSMTVTERTAWPNHWGRFYLPGISSTVCTSSLQATSTACTALATAYQTLNAGLAAADFFLVVPTTQVNKVPNRGLLTVTSVQVDSILDVVRARRARTPLYRIVKP